jgi:hypothetical protein
VEKESLKGLKDASPGEILSYFNSNLDTMLIVDAEVNPMDEYDVRIIACACRSLNDVKRRYSQLENGFWL